MSRSTNKQLKLEDSAKAGDKSGKKKGKKRSSSIRWVILALSTIMLLSIYYCYDIPSALKTQLYSYMKNASDYEFQFSLLYSLYSVPNVSQSPHSLYNLDENHLLLNR